MQEAPKRRPRGLHVDARNINISVDSKEGEGEGDINIIRDIEQLWAVSGEACPDGTIPIRRTKEEEILRASSIKRFGRKPVAAGIRRDSGSTGHEVINSFISII